MSSSPPVFWEVHKSCIRLSCGTKWKQNIFCMCGIVLFPSIWKLTADNYILTYYHSTVITWGAHLAFREICGRSWRIYLILIFLSACSCRRSRTSNTHALQVTRWTYYKTAGLLHLFPSELLARAWCPLRLF